MPSRKGWFLQETRIFLKLRLCTLSLVLNNFDLNISNYLPKTSDFTIFFWDQALFPKFVNNDVLSR